MPTVFISYSQDSDGHKARVHALAEEVRGFSIEVAFDQFQPAGGPPDGWNFWALRQVQRADRVLVVCTQTYERRYERAEEPGVGLGAAYEAGLISQLLYNSAGLNGKFRAVVLTEADDRHVPLELQRYQRFQLWHADSKAEMIAWIRDEPLDQHPTLTWPPAIPDYPWPLADRKEVFAEFRDALAGLSAIRILFLKGPSGRGKTELMKQLRAYVEKTNVRSGWLDCKGTPTEAELLTLIQFDLALLTSTGLSAAMTRMAQLLPDLQRLTVPVVLFIDTYEDASVDTRKWVESQLLPRAGKMPALIVVLGGQEVPEAENGFWADITRLHELSPIRQTNDWYEYSRHAWPNSEVTAQHVEALTLAFQGDPDKVSASLKTVAGQLRAR